MDFQSAMETFAEAWMAANTKSRPGSSDHQSERWCRVQEPRVPCLLPTRAGGHHLCSAAPQTHVAAKEPLLIGNRRDSNTTRVVRELGGAGAGRR
ncbi:hypothetical protein E2C01_051441 [Portunus trituberculatus]|uniref:Uncharacterized protein n=1 Tax=Portunus trituberculatus TaxID=210409 RepID=A0A5B7GAZ7_PORTR|nr:hypothetical protein [Portunus trituberculatus]